MKHPIKFAGLLAVLAIVASACGPAASTTAPTAGPVATTPPAGTTAPATTAPETGMSGKLTLWHSYGSGGGETGALDQVLAAVRAQNPDLTITVVEQPFSDIFTKWQTDVLAGEETPDLYIAPNDNLFSQSDAGDLADITAQLTGKLDGFSATAVSGSQVGGKFFMVPESLKAVALWYDGTAIATAPATTDALLAGVKDKSIKLGLHQDPYFQFGWSGSFGGKLMDDTGKCVADQAGFADAYKYAADLKAAGAKFYTDGNAMKQDFQTGKLNAMVDGPWLTADLTAAYATTDSKSAVFGHTLAVAPIPAGPGGAKADPMTGTDGWYINPNSPNVDLAVQFALNLVSTHWEQVFVDFAGHIPAAPGVTIKDPIVQGFADAAASGLARPQNAELNNYWGNFGDALNAVLDKGTDATAAIATACTTMNTANKK
jgi:arabinogalactan oligomer / maltooligosaccharide transport system substrate-binding protein